jgi:glutamate racemase
MSHSALPSDFAQHIKVGLFDSGVGGLSILRAIREHMPHADLLYVADSAHAPYGEKSEAFIIERSQAIARFLVDQGAQIIVVACNTATAAAVHALRQNLPHTPIVGIEPGVKPAVAASRNQKVGVMATPRTLSSTKFGKLIDAHRHQAEIVLQPCPGLAAAIEGGDLQSNTIRQLIRQYCAPLRAANVDTVVLGCTHYPFVRDLISEEMGPQVQLIDTAQAVARQTMTRAQTVNQAANHNPANTAQVATTKLWSTSDTQAMRSLVTPWLRGSVSIEQLNTDLRTKLHEDRA